MTLGVDDLYAAARARTGLDDLHEAGLGDRPARLLEHINTHPALDDAGRRAGFECVLEQVSNRALLLADRGRYPEIAAERIERPLIVTGMPRSGTTLLQSLLAEHPGSRTPLLWEVVRPSPPVGISPGVSDGTDPRIARADEDVSEMLADQPSLLRFHPVFDRLSATLMECEPFGAMDLRNLYNTAYWQVPTILQADLGSGHEHDVATYTFQRTVLQALQWRCPRRRWTLKGTEHHARLDALKEVFPDAIVVWLHRDPLRFVPSLLELLAGWFEGVTGAPVDRKVVGPMFLGMYKGMLEAGLASPVSRHPDTYHLRYADFIADPIAEIEKLHGHYDLPFGDDARAAMKAWYDDPRNKGDRHGKSAYDLTDFGMSEEQIDGELKEYRDRFEIPYEGR
ncbi:MAG TPA: sulfotransferase [Pseudonocardia sp.]|jgi:hypothetical protein|nr:sulfotransferase [Pseudonocardia sp.]